VSTDLTGYRALGAALIEGALREMKAGGQAATSARAWVAGGRAPVSFDVACYLARLDPDAIRSRLGVGREAA
jgi:hypothetical protein